MSSQPTTLFRSLFSPRAIAAMGVFSSGLLLAEVNVLSARHYGRFDASADQRYSLSEATRTVVTGLDRSTEMTVLLGSGDPLLPELRQLLTAYRALSNRLQIRYVDPDTDTAEFLALSRKFNLGAADESDGAVVSDTAVFLQQEKRTWFIRGAQLSEVDIDGKLRLRMEARLTEGLAQLQSSQKTRVCFPTGHGERSIDDRAPEGLVELRRALERSNAEPVRIALDVPDPQAALKGCRHLAIVGPERPWPQTHVNALLATMQSAESIGFFLDPIVNAEGHIADSGLSEALRQVGVIAEPSFVLEQASNQRLPSGIGEVFFATPKTHPLTQGLSSDTARLDSRVVIAAAQSLRQAPGVAVAPLLQASEEAVTINDLNQPDQPEEQDTPPVIAYAFNPADADQRAVIVGTSNILTNTSFRDPSLYGSRVFSENSFAWLLERKTLVSVPEKPPAEAGLNFTEESLAELLRYVLIYMPLAAASSGAFLLYRRRRREGLSHPRGEATS